jgi:hypothetical protein
VNERVVDRKNSKKSGVKSSKEQCSSSTQNNCSTGHKEIDFFLNVCSLEMSD